MDKATKKKKLEKNTPTQPCKTGSRSKDNEILIRWRHQTCTTNASHGSISKGKICYLCYGEFFSSAFSRRLCTFWLARFFSTDKASSWHSIGCTHVHFDEDISIDYKAWSRAQPQLHLLHLSRCSHIHRAGIPSPIRDTIEKLKVKGRL